MVTFEDEKNKSNTASEMKFYYINKHQGCPQYIGEKPIGFGLVTGSKGEVLTDIIPLPMVIFVISGRIRIKFPEGDSTTVDEGCMVTATMSGGTSVEVLENSMCLRLIIQGDSMNFCHRIVSEAHVHATGPARGKVLRMMPEVKAIVRQMTGYITDGLLCCDIHAMKQRELAAVLQAYCRPSDLQEFIAPIHDPGAKFYNDVMRLAEDWPQVKEIASQMNMSYPTFVRHFKKVFKKPPMEWMSDLRMKRMEEMLRNTTQGEQEISEALRFRTVQDMRSFCKARFGKTPLQVRDGV